MRMLRLATLTFAALLAAGSLAVHAEINSVTGGIAGLDNGTLGNGDGSGDAQIAINSGTLALSKQARDLTGAVLPNGSDIAGGQEIYFVIFVDNTTLFASTDVQVTDLIDEAQFTYVAGSLEQTTVATGSADAAIWAGTWSTRTDGAGDDQASVLDTGGPADADRLTIGAVPLQPNASLTIDGSSLYALRFRVTVN